MKILVSGNSGAGKSTLGKTLANRYGVELFGLDKIVWKEGWQKTSKEEREEKLSEIYKKEKWVIEGVTRSGLKEADIIYFLDIPAYRCAFNVIKRFIKNGLGSRPELPKNCPEYKGVLLSLKIIYIFKKLTVPWLTNQDLRKPDSKFIHIKSYGELDKVLTQITM